MRVTCVLGTRPEAIKLAPLILALRASKGVRSDVVSSGQHGPMLRQAPEGFGLAPDHDMALMRPDQTLTHITAATLHGMAPWPEEVNRRPIARLATRHFAPKPLAAANLRGEGVAEGATTVTRNTGIDALPMVARRVRSDNAPAERFAFLDATRRLIFVTGHRRENFEGGLDRVARLAERGDVQVVFTLHLTPRAEAPARAALVTTDSGGVQEEAPSLGRPVLVTHFDVIRHDLTNKGEWREADALDRPRCCRKWRQCRRNQKLSTLGHPGKHLQFDGTWLHKLPT